MGEWSDLGVALLLVGALTFVTARGVRAQVSPGPLSNAHHELEGNQNCMKCHAAGKRDQGTQCLECHREIAALREAGRGLHSLEGKADCASCHPEHAGADFALIKWEPERFDHSRAGYLLEGKHAAVKCRDCHRADHLTPGFTSRRTDPGQGWLGLDPTCNGCHKDAHGGRLGVDCQGCHTPADWHAVTKERFDHARTRYPLLGKHASVECAKCHDPAKPKNATIEFANCGACHRDPHGGKATRGGQRVDCASCHEVSGFTPSTYARVDHTLYRLEGKHEPLTCAACHRRGGAPFDFRPAHAACRDCHADAHAGQLTSRADHGACESCHDIAGWADPRFGAKEHASTRFPLDATHQALDCAACHGPKRRGLPPLPSKQTLGSAGVLLAPLESECTSCHVDPHAGRFGARGERPAKDGCATCHQGRHFRPSIVDLDLHGALGAPLRGAHQATACDACHVELKSAPAAHSLLLDRVSAMFQSARPSTCEGCHRDPHAAQFASRPGGADCARCHDEEAFRPASRFSHERDTKFSLSGAHARTACSRCHPVLPGAETEGARRYAGTPGECRACHADSLAVPGGSRK